jgi:hypothetical protein
VGYLTKFLIALAFDVVVESAVGFLVLRKMLKIPNLGGLKIAYAGMLVNFSSLPYLWLVLPAFIRNYVAYVIVGEALVFLWEAIFYRMYFSIGIKQAMILSLLANTTSFLLGISFLRLLV